MHVVSPVTPGHDGGPRLRFEEGSVGPRPSLLCSRAHVGVYFLAPNEGGLESTWNMNPDVTAGATMRRGPLLQRVSEGGLDEIWPDSAAG